MLVGLGLAGIALSAAACGGGSSSSSTSNTSATTATPATAAGTSGSGGGGTSASGGGTAVTVGETDFKLALSITSFSPGAYTFKAVNNGAVAHALEITGPGVQATTPTLQPGQSAELHVTLQEGSYDVFCPVDSHKSLGMNTEISVGMGAAGSGSQSSPPTTASPAPSSGGGGGGY
jgi:uncharacterized cupredoxin-like copper-binding protein